MGMTFMHTLPAARTVGRAFAGWLILTLALPVGLTAQTEPRQPTEVELAGISERGRALADYDFAAWHGTDAVVASKPADGVITRYIARPTAQGWVVAFGRLTASRDTFLIAYEAVRTSQTGAFEGFTAVHHDPPVADTDYYAHAARAIDTALVDFGPVRRSYNVAALPRSDGSWYVYLFPAPTVVGVWPLGADIRYLISRDGRSILEKRRLHNTVIEFSARLLKPPPPGSKIQAGVHTAVLAEIPEDTDVFHVLTRTPHVAEYVMTDHFIYRIDTDGKVIFLGTH
jgi:hypothetical protein